jgi:hypothetical protein
MHFEHRFHPIRLRLRSLFRRPEAESELDEESQSHLDRSIEVQVNEGLSSGDPDSGRTCLKHNLP